MASPGQRRRLALGLAGWAVLASWACGSSHTLSSAVRHWAQWVRRKRLGPACWKWVMAVRWTWPRVADWVQVSRTLGGGRSPH